MYIQENSTCWEILKKVCVLCFCSYYYLMKLEPTYMVKKELWDCNEKLSRLGVCTERGKKRSICLGGYKKYLMHCKSVLYIDGQYPGI